MTQPAPPTLREAAAAWAEIGVLGFGGPAGQIALMHRMLVEERRWISEERFLHALNFCMLLPGPEAQQLAIYVGWLLNGTRGGIVAGTLFVLPGLVIIVALAALYAIFHETAWLASVFFGLKAAVLAIVIEAVLRIGKRALRGSVSVALAAVAFLAIYALRIPFPLIVLAAGVLGFAAPHLFGASAAADAEALADSDPRAARSAAATIIVWGIVWAAPVVLLGFAFGWSSTYVALGGFFSLMAVVTFGGAYAVLAYVAQAAVSTYHWLLPGQMLDGVALAETTPGPLVLVLTFVGFLAAFASANGLPPLAAGILGAAITAWVTFVPSFLWIFLGAPYVERLRGDARLASALAAITAAVLGVILNLAVFLGVHVLFREVGELGFGPIRGAWPVWASLDWGALGLAVVAAVALFWFRLGVLWTLAICCLLGLAIRLI
jgi:chromate transporter